VSVKENRVRMTELRESMYIERLTLNSCKVTYQTWVDPGGYIPAILVNMTNKVVYNTLKGVMQMAKSKKHKE